MSNARGICALCLEERVLCDSHLLPKKSYKLLEGGSDPVVITQSIARQTSQQIKQYLLCSDCEQLLSKNGEEYVLNNCRRDNNSFKLLQSIKSKKPAEYDDEIKIYDSANLESVNIQNLIYFGISIFWRASAKRWKTGYTDRIKINIGPKYQESFRQYLHGEENFPKHISIILFVDEDMNDLPICSPYGGRYGKYHRYQFQFHGLQYILSVGKAVPRYLKNICLYKSRKVVVGNFKQSGMFQDALKVLRYTKRSRSLEEKYGKAKKSSQFT